MPRVVLPLVLALALTGCASEPTKADRPTPSATGTISPACEPRVTVSSRRPTVVYALRLRVAPGARRAGRQDASRYIYPPVSPGYYLTRPSPGTPDRELADALEALTPRASALVDGMRGLSWDVRNRGSRPARYLVYGGATTLRGRWTAPACGSAPAQSGTLLLFGRIRAGTARCGEARSTDALRRAAARLACERDTEEARPFRTLRR